jgi:hypothetical protein
MKSLKTRLVSAGVLVGVCIFVAASPVAAEDSDTFILLKKGKVVETVTLTEAQEGAGGTSTFATPFPRGTILVGAVVVGDEASFMDTGKNFFLQIHSDGNNGGGNDQGESVSRSIVTKNGKPSPVADTLLIGSDMAVPAPEPGTIGLLCAGLVGLGFWLKTRAKHG